MSPLSAVAAALDRLHIPYAIGGSMASSARGVPRSTLDVDIVARIGPQHAEALAAALGPEWYADVDQIRDSISAKRAFNIIHRPSMTKVDVFPALDEFHFAQLQRATPTLLEFFGDKAEYPVATAEDILLAKLQWYRAGGEVSERQWTDITGLVATNIDLDMDYLCSWSHRLGVEDLLNRVLRDRA